MLRTENVDGYQHIGVYIQFPDNTSRLHILKQLYTFQFLNRFETQEDTGKHLQELQNRAEKEIRDLGAVKEKLEAEWELVKFMGQEENTELREKLEILEEDITDQQVRVN